MNRYYSLLLLVFFAFNCSNENVNEPEQTQELTLKQVNYVSENTPNDCQGQFLDFDSQGKVIEFYSSCDSGIVTHRTYTYTDSDLISGYTQGFGGVSYDYENDLLVEMRNPGFELKFTYENNLMIGNMFQAAVPTSKYNIYEFEDDSFTKMLSVKSFDSSNGVDELVSRTTYQYDGNNPIEIYIETTPFGSSTMLPNKKITITYDNNINPYKKGLSSNAYLATETVLRDYVNYNIAFSADNNITSIFIEDFLQNTTYTITYSYQYNTDSYPIEAMINEEGFLRTEYFYYY